MSSELIDAHLEQVSRRALHKFLRSKHPSTITKDLPPPNTKVYFYRNEVKGGSWLKGTVLYPEGHLVFVYTSDKNKSNPLQVAFEDIRLVPDSDILSELDRFELGHFDLTPLVDEVDKAATVQDPSIPPNNS